MTKHFMYPMYLIIYAVSYCPPFLPLLYYYTYIIFCFGHVSLLFSKETNKYIYLRLFDDTVALPDSVHQQVIT